MPNSVVRNERPYSAAVTVAIMVAAMAACVLGLIVWKAIQSYDEALSRGERDIRNLAHSLAEQASRSIQAADIATRGVVDLLKYQRPRTDRLNLFLRNTVEALPQLREMGVLDVSGNWIYSSLDETPQHNNADRSYFIYHRDTSDPGLRVSEPLVSRITNRRTIVLSRRISNQDGSFGGVLVAAIDSDFFDNFYKAFNFGPHAGITLLRNDGVLLARWPTMVSSITNASPRFKANVDSEPAGYFKFRSPFDGYEKYYGFEHASQYPILVTVALTEDELLAGWRERLHHDITVAAILMCAMILLAALVTSQFRARFAAERELRRRESHYRLLADNIADVVILLDKNGIFRFVSQSVESVLGLKPEALIGRSCFDAVHPDDLEAVLQATAELTDWTVSKTVVFRTWRGDGEIAWVELNSKLAGAKNDHRQVEVVGVLRDVTERRRMEDELNALNARLKGLATTDGLTGLANRRSFDLALPREFRDREQISVIMVDVDHFKRFNDTLGHQAGDECLKRVAGQIGDAIRGTAALAARYGGEEFSIIVPDADEMMVRQLGERIRLNVQALCIDSPAPIQGCVSVSVGIASRTSLTADENELLREADRALYEAKGQGRNRSVFASRPPPGTVSSPSISPDGSEVASTVAH